MPIGRAALVLALIALVPNIALGQSDDRVWGYAFAAPSFFSDSVAIPTSLEPFSLTPRTFDVRPYSKSTLHWGLGVEWRSVAGLGIAAELSAIHLITDMRPEGMLSANASYHFSHPSRRMAPFVTGGYSFGINSNHGFDLGGGVNYWLRQKVGLRFEVRATALKNVNLLTVPGRFEPYATIWDARVGVNFGRH